MIYFLVHFCCDICHLRVAHVRTGLLGIDLYYYYLSSQFRWPQPRARAGHGHQADQEQAVRTAVNQRDKPRTRMISCISFEQINGVYLFADHSCLY